MQVVHSSVVQTHRSVFYIPVRTPNSLWHAELRGNEMIAGTKTQKRAWIFPVDVTVQQHKSRLGLNIYTSQCKMYVAVMKTNIDNIQYMWKGFTFFFFPPPFFLFSGFSSSTSPLSCGRKLYFLLQPSFHLTFNLNILKYFNFFQQKSFHGFYCPDCSSALLITLQICEFSLLLNWMLLNY